MPVVLEFEKLVQQISADMPGFIQARCQAIATSVIEPARKILGDAMKQQDEYKSLSRNDFGSLAAAFGLSDGERAADAVVGAVERSLTTVVEPAQGRTLGGVSIYAVRSTFEDVIGEASYALQTPRYKADGRWVKSGAADITIVDWLKWLLFRGGDVLIAGFDTNKRPVAHKGRSGTGTIMLKWKNHAFKLGDLGGDRDANWLTKSIDIAAPTILELLKREADFA